MGNSAISISLHCKSSFQSFRSSLKGHRINLKGGEIINMEEARINKVLPILRSSFGLFGPFALFCEQSDNFTFSDVKLLSEKFPGEMSLCWNC